jgi:hypothetical protein
MENEIRMKCYQDIKSMTIVEVEKYKIIRKGESDQKMKVIAKEYEALHQALSTQKTNEISKLDSKGKLLQQVRALRESIKQKKR